MSFINRLFHLRLTPVLSKVSCWHTHNIRQANSDTDNTIYLQFLHDEICKVGRVVLVHNCTRDRVSETLQTLNNSKLEMWANAQHDGRSAEYRWRPLFNAAKFGWCPLLECRAVMLPKHKTRWNYLGCPKLTKRSQLLVSWSSPYCEDMWRRYCCLTSFVPIVDMCISCEDIARQSCAMVPRWRYLATLLGLAFPVSRVQHVSDLHSKFALGPHHV